MSEIKGNYFYFLIEADKLDKEKFDKIKDDLSDVIENKYYYSIVEAETLNKEQFEEMKNELSRLLDK